jgi:DedD protein
VQEHLKIRLTGAIILVVMVVLLVPEMFRGQAAGHTLHGEAATGDLPVHRVNIDLRNDLAPPSAVAPSPGPGPATGTQATRNTPGSTQPLIPAAAPAAPATHTAVLSASGDTAVAPSQLSAAVPTPSPTGSMPAPRATGRWTVQVGSFSRRDFAERMVKQLRAKGFTVVAAGPDDRGLYRVRSASMSSRASADALRQKMVQKGLKPIVNAAP